MLTSMFNPGVTGARLVTRGSFIGSLSTLHKSTLLTSVPARKYYVAAITTKQEAARDSEDPHNPATDASTSALLPNPHNPLYTYFFDPLNKLQGKPTQRAQTLMNLTDTYCDAVNLIHQEVEKNGSGSTLVLGQEYLFSLTKTLIGRYRPTPLNQAEAEEIFARFKKLSSLYDDCYMNYGSLLYEMSPDLLFKNKHDKGDQILHDTEKEDSLSQLSTDILENSKGHIMVQNKATFLKNGSIFAEYAKKTDFGELDYAKPNSRYIPGDTNGVVELLDKQTNKKIILGVEICLDHNVGMLIKNWPADKPRPNIQAILSASVALKKENVYVQDGGVIAHVDLTGTNLYKFLKGTLTPITPLKVIPMNDYFDIKLYDIR